nr:immunoglobulin heavy chain junction region [Mus musculus]
CARMHYYGSSYEYYYAMDYW